MEKLWENKIASYTTMRPLHTQMFSGLTRKSSFDVRCMRMLYKYRRRRAKLSVFAAALFVPFYLLIREGGRVREGLRGRARCVAPRASADAASARALPDHGALWPLAVGVEKDLGGIDV